MCTATPSQYACLEIQRRRPIVNWRRKAHKQAAAAALGGGGGVTQQALQCCDSDSLYVSPRAEDFCAYRDRGDPALPFHHLPVLAALKKAAAAAVAEQDFLAAIRLRLKAAVLAGEREVAEECSRGLRGIAQVPTLAAVGFSHNGNDCGLLFIALCKQ